MEQFKVGQAYFPKHPVKPAANKTADSKETSFQHLLKDKIAHLDEQQVKFSSHAKQRLDQRGINLNPQVIEKLNDAVDKAAKKGVKDSLVLIKDIAFVVNIPKKVVITTVDESSMKEHIFTNIDGAIII